MTRRLDAPATVVEVQGRQLGVLVAEHTHYLFFAAVPEAAHLDGARFRSIEQSQRAVAQLVARSRARPAHAATLET